jgi:uncharacterized iron-regulated membrane protein
MGVFYLHVGAIGGMTTKIIAFFASLIVASLPITGFYVWWLRKVKTKRGIETSKSLNERKLF